MRNFLISFNVVFPIAVMMALGFLFKKIRLVNGTTVKQMNNVVFRVLLPVMIVKNVYESDLSSVFDPKLVIFAVSCVVAGIAVLLLVVPLIEKNNAKRGVLIQGMFRSNFVIFGIPVTQALCGDGVSGAASLLIAVVIPVFNFAAVIILEIFNGNKPNPLKILKGIITNPLIIGSVIGLLINVCGISLPSVIETSVSSIASITTPLALIMLGASINFSSVGNNLWHIVCGVGVKLVVLPAVCLSLAAFVFGFRGAELCILIALFASPAAVSSFTMAQQMGGDDELAGHLVMFGTVACIFTMFLWILTAMQLGFI